MSRPIIEVRNLSKVYRLGNIGATSLKDELAKLWDRVRGRRATDKKGEFWALRDVSFEVQPGEVVGIIGRNGAGKSTLLKILSRITQQTHGEITLRGRVASLLEVGTGFHPDLTGRENIFLNGAILGMSKAEIRAKLDEIIAFAEVEQFIDTPVKRYSSGMYVRLAFAVAAHLEPEILIVDEVLAVGDAEFQRKCLGKIHDVSADEGRTVLFVSHNMAALSSLANSAVVLKEGKVCFLGNVEEAIAKYFEAGSGAQPGKYRAQRVGPSPGPFIEAVEVQCARLPNQHVSGDPFEVVILLNHGAPMTGACVSFQILNRLQQPVIHCWLYDCDTAICREGPVTRLRCRIPRLKLNIGHYSLAVYFSEPPGGQIFETLEGICTFEVIILRTQTMFGWRPDACSYLEDFVWNQEPPPHDHSAAH